jgi:hypothetical protein
VAFAWLAMNAPAAAHPGHGREGGDYSLLHHVIEPEHLIAGVVALLVSALCVRHAARAIRAFKHLRT